MARKLPKRRIRVDQLPEQKPKPRKPKAWPQLYVNPDARKAQRPPRA